jgi:hypothetical protein
MDINTLLKEKGEDFKFELINKDVAENYNSRSIW